MSTRIRLALAFLLLTAPAWGQTGTSKSTSALTTEVNTLWPDNNGGQITPFNARQTLLDMIQSYFNILGSVPLPTLGNNTVLGNVAGAGATATSLTTAQLTTLCNIFSSTLSGCVGASSGGTTNFLRADGSWTVPPGTSAGPAGANTQVQFNSGGTAFGANTDFRFVDPQIISGSVGTNTGQFCLTGVISGLFCQTANAAAGTWTATWPATAGTNGFVLTTNGSGALSWTNPVSGGTVTQVNTAGFITGGPITTTGTAQASALAAPMSLRQGAL